jgi:arylamine N-acetyltransferase
MVGSKHLFFKETSRVVVDVEQSLLIEPRVLIYDGSCDKATFTLGAYPEEAQAKWGDRRGCWRSFVNEDSPELRENIRHISIPDLDSAAVSAAAKQLVNIAHAKRLTQASLDQQTPAERRNQRLDWHPWSEARLADRYCVTDRFHQSLGATTHRHPRCHQHLLLLCFQLGWVQSSQLELLNRDLSRRVRTTTNLDPIRHFKFSEMQHSWHQQKIAAAQWAHFNSLAKPGEIVVRDPHFGHAIFVCATCRTERDGELRCACIAPDVPGSGIDATAGDTSRDGAASGLAGDHSVPPATPNGVTERPAEATPPTAATATTVAAASAAAAHSRQEGSQRPGGKQTRPPPEEQEGGCQHGFLQCNVVLKQNGALCRKHAMLGVFLDEDDWQAAAQRTEAEKTEAVSESGAVSPTSNPPLPEVPADESDALLIEKIKAVQEKGERHSSATLPGHCTPTLCRRMLPYCSEERLQYLGSTTTW